MNVFGNNDTSLIDILVGDVPSFQNIRLKLASRLVGLVIWIVPHTRKITIAKQFIS